MTIHISPFLNIPASQQKKSRIPSRSLSAPLEAHFFVFKTYMLHCDSTDVLTPKTVIYGYHVRNYGAFQEREEGNMCGHGSELYSP